MKMHTLWTKPYTHPRLLLSDQHDLSSFASTDERRYVLQSLHIDSRGFVEATDGRKLLQVPVNSCAEEFPSLGHPYGPGDTLMPMAAVKKALGNRPKRPTLPILANVLVSEDECKGKLCLSTTDQRTDQTVAVPPIDGNYPNTDLFFSKQPEPTATVTLSAYHLRAFCDYAIKHGEHRDKDMRSITFAITDDASQVYLTIAIADGEQATGLIMPIRTT